MLRQPTLSDIHLNNIIASLKPAVGLLTELNDVLGSPFVQVIANTTLSLVAAVQNIKRNQTECLQIMEHIHGLICAIVGLHIKSEIAGKLPLEMLDQIGKFTKTLQKIHMFITACQGGNRLKQFFQKNEMATLLKNCNQELQQAMEVFKVEHTTSLFNNIHEMRLKTEAIYEELLEMISTMSGNPTSDGTSSIYQQLLGSQNSSNSFSLLPAEPRIFYGREAEVEKILKTLRCEQPVRIAILGGGGMGKTTLAKTMLHHPDITAKYPQRFFVAAESSTTSAELASQIGLHIGLKPGKDLKQAVVQYLRNLPMAFLVLDNLETSWDPLECRGGVEEFLSMLTDIANLALVITMRGVQRPSKVRWTRPFLPPLNPLPYSAAQEMFFEIADNNHDPEDIDRLLNLTGNMPLAVDLMAHLADSEGCQSLLHRWEKERTSTLSTGYNRKSSLDASIAVSLSSPRITSFPGTGDLLSLLSLLPDGISDHELIQCALPIPQILKCKSVLLSTSLAYCDAQQRLKSLVPIREYMQLFHPPSTDLVFPLIVHFRALLDLYNKYRGTEHRLVVRELDSNQGNIEQILAHWLHQDNLHIAETIYCTLSFNAFHRMTGHGYSRLMDRILDVLPQACDHHLKAAYITEVFTSVLHHPVFNPEALEAEGVDLFKYVEDQYLEASFYIGCGHYYNSIKIDIPKGIRMYDTALTVARASGDRDQQCACLIALALVDYQLGNYLSGYQLGCDARILAQAIGNTFQEATSIYAQCFCCLGLGDYESTTDLTQKARNLLRLCGMSGGRLDCALVNLQSDIHVRKSEYAEARSIQAELVQNTLQEGDHYQYVVALMNTAEIDILIGVAQDSVQSTLEKARVILSKLDSRVEIVLIDCHRGALSVREGNFLVGKGLLQKSLSLSWGTHSDTMLCCLDTLADVNRWDVTDLTWTSMWTVIYLAYAQKSKSKYELHRALLFLGDVFISNGEEETGESLFHVALEGFTFMHVHRSQAQCMLRLGDLAKNRGDLDMTAELWTDALPLFQRSLQADEAIQIETRLHALRKHEK